MYLCCLFGWLNIVPGKVALHSIQNALTPAIVVSAGDVDDVSLLEDQVISIACVVAVQRHHCARQGIAG